MHIYAHMLCHGSVHMIGSQAEVGTVPDMRNARNIFTIVGPRFGYQSVLDERSGRTSTTSLHEFAFNIYLQFPKKTKDHTH